MSGQNSFTTDYRKAVKKKSPKAKAKPKPKQKTSGTAKPKAKATAKASLSLEGNTAGKSKKKAHTLHTHRPDLPKIFPNLATDIEASLLEIPPTGLRWTIVLLCTAHDSYIKQFNPYPQACTVVEVTIDDDFTSESGYLKVHEVIQQRTNVVLFVSFPCTGGCLFNTGINAHNPKCAKRIQGHWKLFSKLWKNLERIYDYFGNVLTIFEWPRYCAYWSYTKVARRFKNMNMYYTDFDGCQYHLRPKHPRGPYEYLKKPWTFATNLPECVSVFNKLCPGTCKVHQHVSVCGPNALHSQYYTPHMTLTIHCVIFRHFRNKYLREYPQQEADLWSIPVNEQWWSENPHTNQHSSYKPKLHLALCRTRSSSLLTIPSEHNTGALAQRALRSFRSLCSLETAEPSPPTTGIAGTAPPHQAMPRPAPKPTPSPKSPPPDFNAAQPLSTLPALSSTVAPAPRKCPTQVNHHHRRHSRHDSHRKSPHTSKTIRHPTSTNRANRFGHDVQ